MKKRTAFLLILICLLICIFCLILIQGRVFNRLCVSDYAVRGVDVSEYQGQIGWDTLQHEGISFAFIKATEGSSYTDPYFNDNWSNARESGVLTGAYHFFSFDSKAETQADNLSRMFPMWRTRCHRLLILSFTANTKRYIPPIRILSYLSLVAYSTVLKVNMERGRSYMQPHRPIESLYPDTLTTILFGFEACIFLRHGVSGIAGHSGSIPIRQGFRDTADRNLVSI